MSMNGSHAGPPQPFGPPIPGDRSTMFTAFAAVCLFFVAVAVGLRMARCRMNHIFRPDDHLILFCGVLALVTTTLDCVGGHYGAGRHLSNIPLENLHYATKLPLIAGSFLTITLALTKLSVALTLLRINISKLYVIIIAITATVAVLGNVQLAIIIPLGCASARQDPNASSYCISKHGIAIVSYLQAVVNIVTDVAFVLTPMIGLRSIKLARKDKIATNILLAFIFTYVYIARSRTASDKLQGYDRLHRQACNPAHICTPEQRHHLGEYSGQHVWYWRGDSLHHRCLSAGNTTIYQRIFPDLALTKQHQVQLFSFQPHRSRRSSGRSSCHGRRVYTLGRPGSQAVDPSKSRRPR